MAGELFEVKCTATEADLDAALKFVRKRARKRSDAVEGVSVALFSVMFATCEGLVECGLSVENVDAMLDQFRQQITKQIQFDVNSTAGMH